MFGSLKKYNLVFYRRQGSEDSILSQFPSSTYYSPGIAGNNKLYRLMITGQKIHNLNIETKSSGDFSHPDPTASAANLARAENIKPEKKTNKRPYPFDQKESANISKSGLGQLLNEQIGFGSKDEEQLKENPEEKEVGEGEESSAEQEIKNKFLKPYINITQLELDNFIKNPKAKTLAPPSITPPPIINKEENPNIVGVVPAVEEKPPVFKKVKKPAIPKNHKFKLI